MKTLQIEVSDSIYEHILFFLQNLPKDKIKISNNIQLDKPSISSTKEKIKELFESKEIELFKKIEEPLM
jgi:hypothetical protein